MEEEKKEQGRPSKYKPEFDDQAYKLTLLGATDKELADFFEVVESTINLWKIEHPSFSESLKKGKIKADADVSERLYKRAIGYQYKEIKTDTDKDGTIKLKTETTKTLAPDPTAQIFWLKNRQPQLWRDTKNIDHTTDGKSMEGMSKDEIVDELKNILADDKG